ncbi:hypothetical protein [Chryseobacterium caseinilyticum]|uniref:Uncharacterized protein n=1 Tax=Chryseobacterium caseinilyticum TaxID=2771428 RepID=A0ABR8Z9S0_9FLAO|nr:hypothetical protein [Chryseobacterium caseinilyticum]MBD8081628.1 hypothetical protein [Chryseobacterium caseinilyticum]
MQFIDFTKEHFSHNENADNYYIQISKDEIGYGDIEVLEKQDDETYTKAEYEVIDELTTVTITMKKSAAIRVNF